jgi:hypothetical protein
VPGETKRRRHRGRADFPGCILIARDLWHGRHPCLTGGHPCGHWVPTSPINGAGDGNHHVPSLCRHGASTSVSGGMNGGDRQDSG